MVRGMDDGVVGRGSDVNNWQFIKANTINLP